MNKTIHCLKDDGTENRGAPTERHDDDTQTERRRSIRCRRCDHEISDAAAVFSFDSDRASRVFANPHGILHEILTLRYARDLVVTSPPTTEFTWYPGYAWEIAHCGQCLAHVGWSFSAVDDQQPATFWGLRRNAIIEDEDHGR